ncbi:MAG TPA: hypothetical protein VGK99_05975 [Acidobacteriota bacterium]|jgi:hypothetical protein
MKIFDKELSEYVSFQKVILTLIVIVGLVRLGLSLAGVSNSVARWFSITALVLIGLVYYSIRIATTGFGSYRHLLPLLFIQNAVATLIIVAAIALAIFTGHDNIFSAPEYSGGGDGKTWGHIGAHVLLGAIIAPLIGWLIGSLILFITRKVVGPRPAAV